MPCFTHFLKTGSGVVDFTEIDFGFGCPDANFEHVYQKKAQQVG
jgi:hypothetical protein